MNQTPVDLPVTGLISMVGHGTDTTLEHGTDTTQHGNSTDTVRHATTTVTTVGHGMDMIVGYDTMVGHGMTQPSHDGGTWRGHNHRHKWCPGKV